MTVVDQLGLGVAPVASPKPRKKRSFNIELTARKVPRKELLHFSRQLAVFIRAGIPILDALQVIVEEAGNKTLREMLLDAIEQLEAGSTFAEAMQRHDKALPPYYVGILRSAELTGRLDTVLVQLAEYVERDLEARQKLVSALSYPAVILATAAVVVTVLVTYVMPKFEKFFASLHSTLPLPTRLLLSVTGFLTHNLPLIGFALVVLIAVPVLVTRRGRARAARDALLLRIPVTGELLRHVLLERFCRILAAMMAAGVALPEALAVTSSTVRNRRFAAGLDEARSAMMAGQGLAGPLAATHLFPPSANQMFRVGESTGTLDEQLETAATYFDRELDYRIKRFTAMFEPAILIVVGLVVAFVAVALVSAMYGMLGHAKSL